MCNTNECRWIGCESPPCPKSKKGYCRKHAIRCARKSDQRGGKVSKKHSRVPHNATYDNGDGKAAVSKNLNISAAYYDYLFSGTKKGKAQ